MKPTTLLLTCEHGGNWIPAAYRAAFKGASAVLRSHRGWDPGALELAQRFASELDAPLFFSSTTRLLVELNRSRHHRSLFSAYTRVLPQEARLQILAEHYQPYRQQVEEHLAAAIGRRERVLHVSVHSFTPVLNDEVRQAEIGLLYDPSRRRERAFSDAWRRAIMAADPALRVRKNYPYLGTADGFTTYLRKQFKDAQYAGVELEVNQRFPLGNVKAWQALQSLLVRSLRQTLQSQA